MTDQSVRGDEVPPQSVISTPDDLTGAEPYKNEAEPPHFSRERLPDKARRIGRQFNPVTRIKKKLDEINSIPPDRDCTNKDTFLSELDTLFYEMEKKRHPDDPLIQNKPPAIEYFFVGPFAMIEYFKLGAGWNSYGHAAIRYTLPSGEQKVANIAGRGKLVQFYTPEGYLFDNNLDQGGIWNRNIFSVRIETCEDWQVICLDRALERLQTQFDRNNASFSICFSHFWNFYYRFCNLYYSIMKTTEYVEAGNCSWYTSQVLKEGGFIPYATMWPLKTWVLLFELQGLRKKSNVHVVSYRQSKNCNSMKYGVYSKTSPFTGISPFHPVQSFFYDNLEKFAHVIVDIPEKTLEVRKVNPDPVPPSRLRANYTLIFYSTLATSVAIFFAYRRIKYKFDHRHRVFPQYFRKNQYGRIYRI